MTYIAQCCCQSPAYMDKVSEILSEDSSFEHTIVKIKPDIKELLRRRYLLCVIDISEPEYFDFAKTVRSRGLCGVILIGNDSKYAMEAFNIDAISYILHPADPLRVSRAIINYMLPVNKVSDYPFLFRESGKISAIPAKEIVFIEYSDHRLRIYLQIGNEIDTISMRESFLKATEPLLRDLRFLRTHESFIVNIMHISKFSPTSLTMSNNRIIPISTTRKSQVKSHLIEYFKDRIIPAV